MRRSPFLLCFALYLLFGCTQDSMADRPVNYRSRAIDHLDKGEDDQAIVDFTEAIRLDPKYAIAYQVRGTAYKEEKKVIAEAPG